MSALPDTRPVIVTGGAGTLGLAIGTALRAEGRQVLLTDIDPAVADAAAGIGARAAIHDLTGGPGPLAGESPSALVNCAGIGQIVPFMALDPALWERVLAVNLTAPLFLTQALAPRMAASGGGAVVNIASVSGLRAGYGRTAYGSSKAALIHLTRQMALELAPMGIRVNAVAPGPVAGPMAEAHPPAQIAEYRATIPQGRYAEPAEIASVVAFLCGAAAHVTGQCLPVDGGWSAAGVGVGVGAAQMAS